MTDEQFASLQQTIRETAARIQKFQERAIGEENTKVSLIEPVLAALGWDTRDPDEVHREFKPTTKDSPVDYALKVMRKPRLFVEAKGLAETLGDRKWIAQILSYATVAGVEWCVLTDGNEYRFYNAAALVDAEEKLFCRIRLSEVRGEDAASMLRLISRTNMEENMLDVLWTAHFIDRRVKETLRRMLDTIDKGLIRLIRKRVPKLTPKEIAQSLRRLDVRIESTGPPLEKTANEQVTAIAPERRKKLQEAGRKAAIARRLWSGVSLPDLIAAGLLAPPLRLFRRYKGQEIEALLMPDGKVEFQGTLYDSCSTAAEIARGTMTGRRMNTNGWTFWQWLDKDDKKLTLFDARKRLAAMKGKNSSQE